MKTYTQSEAHLMDLELDIVHQCLADLYDYKYNNEIERIARIKEVLKQIELLT